MRRSTSTARRACAVGTTIALVGLTTGLGIMTATSASAVEPTTTSTAVADGETTTPAAPTTDAPSADVPSTGAPAADAPVTDAPSTDAPSTDAPSTDAPSTDAHGTSAPAADASATDEPTGSTTTAVRPAASGTVTIDGAATVGSKLTAEPSGFTAPTTLSYSWSVDGTSASQGQSYVVKPADAGKVVMVTVTNTQDGVAVESESAQTDPITQAPVFVGEDGEPITAGTTEDEDLTLTATAGEAFSYTFRATGSPEPVLTLVQYDADDREAAEGWTPADQLPEGLSFDPATGVLSGTTDEASYWSFAVTATSGTASITQTVSLRVEAAAPAGIEATAVDRAAFVEFAKSGFTSGWFDDEEQERSGSFRSWIIKADGSVVTEDTEWESDGAFRSGFSSIGTPGGTPTIPQGGTLLLSGNLVDEFGNPVEDEEGDPSGADIAVRSNVASDVVQADSLLGDAGFVGVTFPHASVHRLTVSASDFSTAFDVQVTPAAVVTVPGGTTPTAVQHGTAPSAARHGRLAYTGAEESTPMAWALGLLVAGAGLIGARTLRRRRARR